VGSSLGEKFFSYPNFLDSAVGCGIGADQSPLQIVIKEAHEEASTAGTYLKDNIRLCGSLTYISRTDGHSGYELGLMVPEVAYVYELEVSDEIELCPNDDEVGQYHLMDVTQVSRALRARQFKPSSAAVMVGFFIWHGIVIDNNEPDYLSLVGHTHRYLPVLIARS
jgi:8-oxo-dGTP pyrophosphatase MutT (NUDIX family)